MRERVPSAGIAGARRVKVAEGWRQRHPKLAAWYREIE